MEEFSCAMVPGTEFVVAITVQILYLYSNIIVRVGGDVFDCCGRGISKVS